MFSPLDGLDEAQREAVTHPGGPLLVVGGAGTGKTVTLTRRFAWLAENRSPPDSVLALMLTSSAASRMRESLEAAIDLPYDELSIFTFDSFCRRLLHDEALEAGVEPFFSAVTAADRVALLLDRIDELTLRHHEIRGNPAPLLAGFVSRIDSLKEQLVGSDDYRRYADSLARGGGAPIEPAQVERELEFAQVYADHDRLLAERGALDSGDLLLRAFELLHTKPHVRQRTGERFQEVLVDDYQDLSFGQGALLRLVCAEHGNLAVAADDHQALHHSGAGRRAIVDFQRDHPEARVVRLERSLRSTRPIVAAARAVVESGGNRTEKRLRPRRGGGQARFWRCRSERAQAQAVAAESERLITMGGVPPEEIAVLVRSVKGEGGLIASALEERAVPFRLTGATAYFQRPEVRDLIAWLRLLADPGDSGAVVRALSRPPIELRSVDIARLTQLARRRKVDMVSGLAAACEGPQLSPEGRDRVRTFLKLHRSAAGAFDQLPPDAFLHRLIERIGLRRQQLFAVQADTVERLMNIAKLSELATSFLAREPGATARDFTRYVAAVAEAGLPEAEAAPPEVPGAVRVMTMEAARGLEFEHVFMVGLTAARMPGPPPRAADALPEALMRGSPVEADAGEDGGRARHESKMRRLLYLALSRSRRGLVLAFPETGSGASAGRPSPFYEEARAAVGASEEVFEEELFGPGEGLHSTFRMMRDEVLDTVSEVGGSLAELRLDTYVDVSRAVVRYLELLKVAALIERAKAGQTTDAALAEVNDLLLQEATPEQRELFRASALDDYLRDTERGYRRRAGGGVAAASGPSLETFIPRRGDGLMLSASDIETYRLCPLKYKFARVFRIPQEPSINQRFGILVHQVLERYHAGGGGSREELLHLLDASWWRSGFGDSNDDRQFRRRAVEALERYWELEQQREGKPVWFERSFSFKLGPHLLRGRVDRVDRLPDGRHELIDYKTGKPKTEAELREDVQLSLYQMGARESWRLETAAQSYYYVLDNEKVPVEHSEEELERVRGTISEIAAGITSQEFEPTPSPEVCSFCDYRIICPAAEA